MDIFYSELKWWQNIPSLVPLVTLLLWALGDTQEKAPTIRKLETNVPRYVFLPQHGLEHSAAKLAISAKCITQVIMRTKGANSYTPGVDFIHPDNMLGNHSYLWPTPDFVNWLQKFLTIIVIFLHSAIKITLTTRASSIWNDNKIKYILIISY